ncbi:MAG: 16S rRNA (cytosine(1402)-N(4))-methyltransferase [Chlamydiia bacterium]|nr:16S rRNA (cytosine(1402)-N(4))-methyltransferase [Chlamydiia bacterium]
MTMDKNKPHLSVMADEMISHFQGAHLRVFVEGTLGAGGHARRLLEAHDEIEMYIGFDQDPEAIEIAKTVLAPWKDKVHFINANFSMMERYLSEMQVKQVDGFFLTSECRPCSSIKSIKGLVSPRMAL